MAKLIQKGKRVKELRIPRNEVKGIKKRITTGEYNKHVGPVREYYMKMVDGKPVENRLPLTQVKNSHESLLHLSEWVHKQIRWRVHNEWDKRVENANEILDKGSGNCNDKAGVLISFLKAVGIPGRFSSVGHSRAEVMLPHDNVEVEFFPSNFMITTKEGQWEIGGSYMRFRDLNEHSLFQFAENKDVFKKKFKDPLNKLLQQKFCEKYKNQYDLWYWNEDK